MWGEKAIMSAAPETAGTSDALSSTWTAMPLEVAQRLAEDIYGIAGVLTRLTSERDDTFMLRTAEGRNYTLKVANPAERADGIIFQTNALLHLAQTAPAVPVPRPVAARDGKLHPSYIGPDGSLRVMRMLTYLDGTLLHSVPATPPQASEIGRSLAILGRGLATFKDIPPDQKLLWDISHTLGLEHLIDHVGSERQPAVRRVLAEFARRIPPAAPRLRRQIIHNDFNPHNILVAPDHPDRVIGIIDFGDMVYAPLINDLAVAASYRAGSGDWQRMIGEMMRGYCSEVPLQALELDLLPTLIKARLAITLIITEWRAASRPENRDYILRNHAAAWSGLRNMEKLSDDALGRFFATHL